MHEMVAWLAVEDATACWEGEPYAVMCTDVQDGWVRFCRDITARVVEPYKTARQLMSRLHSGSHLH